MVVYIGLLSVHTHTHMHMHPHTHTHAHTLTGIRAHTHSAYDWKTKRNDSPESIVLVS